jgi:hypothetical protein
MPQTNQFMPNIPSCTWTALKSIKTIGLRKYEMQNKKVVGLIHVRPWNVPQKY